MRTMPLFRTGSFVILLITMFACKSRQENSIPFVSTVDHPEWSRKAVLYEVNIRQYTPEGTFRAFATHLPRLRRLGVDILWFMPLYPIGEEGRKGTLGSYYAVKDYLEVNPEFGTKAELKALIDTAHAMGFRVLFDWVANHTARDHSWATEHPEWYEHDSLGHFVSPYDWTDVIQLNYRDHRLWRAMVDAMRYWVEDFGIDGYRCDYPGRIPVAFWDSARQVLQGIRPVLLLAEDEAHTALLERAFDMNYAWEYLHLTEEIARGEKNASDLKAYFERQKKQYPPSVYRLNCLTNHDENSWNGTVFERYGKGVRVFALLAFTVPGMPLLYSGQEAGLDKRLKFFEKDTIIWSDTSVWTPFYRTLIRTKHEEEALWNGTAGGRITLLETNRPEEIFSFMREKNGSTVMVVTNLSDHPVTVSMYVPSSLKGICRTLSGDQATLSDSLHITLQAWKGLLYRK